VAKAPHARVEVLDRSVVDRVEDTATGRDGDSLAIDCHLKVGRPLAWQRAGEG
jgi:hypothetical protein